MADTTITCPKCRASFEVTAAMTAQIEQGLRTKYEAEAARQSETVAARERAVLAKETELDRAREAVDAMVAAKVGAEKGRIAEQAKALARQENTAEMKLLQERVDAQAKEIGAHGEREAALARKERELQDATRKADAKRKADEAALAADRSDLDALVADKLRTERVTIAAEEARKAKLAAQTDIVGKDKEIKELADTIAQLNGKLTTAQEAEATARRTKRELDERLREVNLDVERRVAEAVGAAREKAIKDADSQHRLRVAEKDKTIRDLEGRLEDALRKAQQGSEKLQGEVQELDLESALRDQFPRDSFEPVAEGQSGADLLQCAVTPTGKTCGAILWESKRTARWNDSWLAKLRHA